MRELRVSQDKSVEIVSIGERLYIGKMRDRFSEIRIKDRLKRTNPFLLHIRGVQTVKDWAFLQLQSALYASEEEAVGHLLEAIAKICHPGARAPLYPDDFDFEVAANNEVTGYQVKMSWDCMPMSTRKNLSNTIRRVRELYERDGIAFTGVFAPCYGRATTSRQPGQEYLSLRSREFWTRVGDGDENYDVKVASVCALLCGEFRATVSTTLLPSLTDKLAAAAESIIGNGTGQIDYPKLVRAINL